jgi:DNA-binding response OmpR family regulator
VRAGAIPLLTLLRELGVPTPWTLVYDEDGNDIHTIIKALQLGAREYVLASDPEVQRRLNARLLVERASTRATVDLATAPAATPPPALAAASPFSMEWDPIGRVIHIGEKYLRLSSVEARIFDRMLANRAHTVGVADLVSDALMQPNLEASVGARRLRPHVMRLRRKLERFPVIGMRIVNIRGTGYMMIESAIC